MVGTGLALKTLPPPLAGEIPASTRRCVSAEKQVGLILSSLRGLGGAHRLATHTHRLCGGVGLAACGTHGREDNYMGAR